MNIANIKPCDIANGPGVRVSVFVSGCRRHCKGCHNAEAWDFGYGEPYTEQTKEYILELLEPDYIDGISILGGEPFEPENAADLLDLVWQVYEKTGKTVWIYTGYMVDDLIVHTNEKVWKLLMSTEILVDGEYQEKERDVSLRFRGSRNQRIIDVSKTLDIYFRKDKIEPVLWEGEKNGQIR